MTKKEFRLITSKDYKFIPWNVVLIRDKEGWVFIAKQGTQWYVNSTQDNKDGKEDEPKFLRRLVKALKVQLHTEKVKNEKKDSVHIDRLGK